MRATGVGTGWIGLAVALALGAGCTLIIGVDAGHERMTTGTGGSTSSSGATGGAPGCTPGMPVECYEGPSATRDVGECKHGTQTCGPSRTPEGACAGQVLPAPTDDCSKPNDANCDGIVCSANVLGAVFDAGVVNGVAVDAMGNAFVAGSFAGTIVFGSTTLLTAGAGDLFLAKLDPTGAPLWAKHYGSAADETQSFVASTPDGGVILAGPLPKNIDLGCGPLTNASSGVAADIFVAKLDAQGVCTWSQAFGATFGVDLGGIATDPAGDLVLAGSIHGSVSFGGTPLPYQVMGFPGFENFAAKLRSSDGSAIWSQSFGVVAIATVDAVAVDPSGDVVLGGHNNIGPGVSFDGVHKIALGIFVVRLDSFGNYAWSTSFAATPQPIGSATLSALAVDKTGNIFLVGAFSPKIQFGLNPQLTTAGDFLAKLDVVTGVPLWSKSFGVQTEDVTVDGAGNLVLTGNAQGTFSFGGPTLTAQGTDAVLAKLDNDGTYLWSQRFGDAQAQGGIAVRTMAGSNQIVMAGDAAGQIDFGKGPLTCPGHDVFVATFEP